MANPVVLKPRPATQQRSGAIAPPTVEWTVVKQRPKTRPLQRRAPIREFMPAAACSMAWQTPASATEPAQDEDPAYAIGVQTYLSFLPMMDLYRTLWETSFDPERGHDRTVNEYFVFDRLITSKDDWVISPNNDTIYLRAFLDLRAEPILLVIPPMGDRQYWVPVSDMHHDFDANLSWDTVGPRGGAFALCPPGWQGVLPEGVQRIDMGTPIIWTLPRIAVDGDPDLPAAIALQKQFRLVPLSQWGADGSLEIFLQHEEPTNPVERANWLPAPQGRFYLVTRHYSPRAPILTGDWVPPPITQR